MAILDKTAGRENDSGESRIGILIGMNTFVADLSFDESVPRERNSEFSLSETWLTSRAARIPQRSFPVLSEKKEPE